MPSAKPPHLVVYSAIQLHYGGLEYVLLQLLQALAPRYRLTVLSAASSEFQADLARFGIAWQPTHTPAPFSAGTIWTLAKQFRQLDADLIHTVEPRGSTVACPAAKLARLPTLHINHISPLDYENISRSRWWLYALGEALLGWGFIDATIFVAQAIQNRYESHHLVPRSRSHYIPNSLPADFSAQTVQRAVLREQWHLTPQDFVWLNLGRLTPQKGQDILIQASQLLPDHLPWQLWIGGSGVLEAELQAQIQQLGLTERVFLLGKLSRTEAFQRLSAADAFVLPSRYENMPITLLEALALNRPCVVTEVGDSWLMVGGGDLPAAGLNVPVDNPSSLAKAMYQLMSDSALYQQCQTACAARLVPFTDDRTVQTTENLILDLLRQYGKI